MKPTCKIEDCTAQAENPELGLCATHAREMRKRIEQAKSVKKLYTIPQRSEKGKQKQSALQQTYKLFDKTTPHFCSNCGISFDLTHSHILPQGQYLQHAANIINIVYDCFTCHDIWEHGTLEECEQLLNFKYRVSIIRKLAPEHFFRKFGVTLQDYAETHKNI